MINQDLLKVQVKDRRDKIGDGPVVSLGVQPIYESCSGLDGSAPSFCPLLVVESEHSSIKSCSDSKVLIKGFEQSLLVEGSYGTAESPAVVLSPQEVFGGVYNVDFVPVVDKDAVRSTYVERGEARKREPRTTFNNSSVRATEYVVQKDVWKQHRLSEVKDSRIICSAVVEAFKNLKRQAVPEGNYLNPQVSYRGATLIVSFKELLGDVQGSFDIMEKYSLKLNPGNSACFPQLSFISRGWFQYCFKSLRFLYQANVGPYAAGEVVICPHFSGHLSEQSVIKSPGSCGGVCWQDGVCDMQIGPSEVFRRISHSGYFHDVVDDCGTMGLYTLDGLCIHWGRLWVDYEVEFRCLRVSVQAMTSGFLWRSPVEFDLQRPVGKTLISAEKEIKNQVQSGSRACIVCMVRGLEVLFEPCCHICMCGMCSAVFLGVYCPVCSLRIESRKRVFL